LNVKRLRETLGNVLPRREHPGGFRHRRKTRIERAWKRATRRNGE
jgi:hypothetical protein